MSSMVRATGLSTFYNELNLPDGALTTADNVVIDRNNIIRPRRGLTDYGTAAPCLGTYDQIITYKERLLPYDGTTLFFDSDCQDGCFSGFSGTFSPTETGLRIKSAEVNGNLYFTTDDGIKKISGTISSCTTNFTTSSGFITSSGGTKALDVTGSLIHESGGFLVASPSCNQTAYRIVWAIEDANNNLILGSPSSRLVMTNSDTCNNANVNLTFTVPSDVDTTDYFYQIFRTGLSDNCVDPGDEMNLIIQNNITAAQICAGTITVKDQTPDSFRESGLLLYTNPVSGCGILQANEKPPLAKDIDLFRETLFYSNTQTIHRQQFTLLGVSCFTSGVSKFIVGNSTTDREYTFVGVKEVTSIVADTNANMTDGGYFLLNSASDINNYFVWFDKTGTTCEPSAADTSGKIAAQVNISGDTTAAQVATTLQGVLNALPDFCVSVCCATVTITNIKNGNSVDAIDGLTVSGVVSITVTTQGDGENADTVAGGDVLLSSLISPSLSIDETGRSLVNIINRDSNGIVNAFYLSGVDDLPGLILLEGKNLSDSEFYIGLDDACTDITNQFTPKLSNAFTISSMADNGCGCVRVTTSTCHGFAINQNVFIYNETNCVHGKFKISAVTGTTFDIVEIFTCTSAGNVFAITQTSNNDVKPNRVFYSKTGIPEAVPLVNFIDIGRQDSEIKRILALRDQLFVLKEDGVYIITGGVGVFSAKLLGTSTNITAPDSAAVLNNQIFMLSTQGIVSISDTGIGVVSRNIEDKIQDVTGSIFNTNTVAFGVSYETDRTYILWLPTIASDTVATQAYRYNTFNNSWVRWTIDARAGVVNPKDDKLYISSGTTSFLEQERKDNDRSDFADRQFNLSILKQTVCETTKLMELNNVACVNVGDVLVQTQNLTATKFNRLLRKLDLDAGLDDINYSSSLAISTGGNMAQALIDVAAKIDIDDTCAVYTVPSASPSTSAIILSDFNVLIGELNASSGPAFNSYTTISSSDTTDYEAIITAVDQCTNKVTLAFTMPFLFGTVVHYQGINSIIEWIPQHFGDPSILKQVPEGTFVFDGNNFFNATASYSTDLSKEFTSFTFRGRGPGFSGGFEWNETAWGGDGTDVPYRSLIPRNKQRCRYIIPKFAHLNAREEFNILGISFKVRPLSTRSYREV